MILGLSCEWYLQKALLSILLGHRIGLELEFPFPNPTPIPILEVLMGNQYSC